jgi:cbb3-type cytochrome oxidase maturation protein
MSNLLILIPIALALGAAGLAAFLWALHNGQFTDPEGDGARILLEDEIDETTRARQNNQNMV